MAWARWALEEAARRQGRPEWTELARGRSTQAVPPTQGAKSWAQHSVEEHSLGMNLAGAKSEWVRPGVRNRATREVVARGRSIRLAEQAGCLA